MSFVKKAEEFFSEYKSYLPVLGRVLIVLTFVEDTYRIMTNWEMQLSFLEHSENNFSFPHFLAVPFLLFTLVAQALGGLLVILNKKIQFACTMLLVFMGFLILVYGFGMPEYVHHHGRLRFLFRSMSIIGGLLMLIADDRVRQAREANYFAGVPVLDPLKMANAMQLAGRGMLALMCFQFYTHGYVFGALCTLASVAVLAGFQTKYMALAMTLLLTVSNLVAHNFWDSHPDDYDAAIYFFFQDMSVMGGFILLISLGPGGISMDGKKSL
mmetsp:Transcript_15804/g.30934  ORF Transcript_15804/g.30934 Transcript_15804/m.30934 type:complete len:269 (-) Transcript_15804:88-894(-)|eukprot:CAMPEP_0175149838 /NCGR_PEP_ID=MMETSP0087-20121206/17491_1 /TAXON_ID=136419 /ORGANISM="Unknown Unknown, Strain D1" /LENGTH=268 /DNA_ID=CAMNT_0016435625 /DNA_START=56 /DNA_END=862 /DNA_ORIENTATION=-